MQNQNSAANRSFIEKDSSKKPKTDEDRSFIEKDSSEKPKTDEDPSFIEKDSSEKPKPDDSKKPKPPTEYLRLRINDYIYTYKGLNNSFMH